MKVMVKAILNKDGVLLEIYSQAVFPNFHGEGEGAESQIFYDPFDGPVYQYIRWSNVSPDTLERILNITFTPEDLIDLTVMKLSKFPKVVASCSRSNKALLSHKFSAVIQIFRSARR